MLYNLLCIIGIVVVAIGMLISIFAHLMWTGIIVAVVGVGMFMYGIAQLIFKEEK